MKTRGKGMLARGARFIALGSALAMALVAVPVAPVGAQGVPGAPSGVHVLGWGFSDVSAMAISGPDLFVADSTADMVTELDAKTRDLVRVIYGPAYGFDDPVAMVAVKGKVFVANAGRGGRPGSVTELTGTTGALVKVISGPSYRFVDPVGMVGAQGHLFVLDGGWVTELSASDGALVKVLSQAAYHFDEPTSIASDGRDVFVADGNEARGWVSVLDASNGAALRVFPEGVTVSPPQIVPVIAVGDGHVFVGGAYSGVQELDAATGKAIKALPGSFNDPVAMAVSGPHLFVADQGTGGVFELDARSGAELGFMGFTKFAVGDPAALLASGSHLFVGGSDTVAEVSTGPSFAGNALIGATTGSRYRFADPVDLAVSGRDLFVLSNVDGGSASVSEVVPSTGALVRVMSGPAYHFDIPVALALSGPYLFVANNGGGELATDVTDTGSVTEIDTTTGRVVRVITGDDADPVNSQVDQPYALAVIGKDLFVANYGNNSVAEVDIASGAVVKVLSGPKYNFSAPGRLAVSGSDLFVASEDLPYSVTELNSTTGAVVKTFPNSGVFSILANGPDLFTLSNRQNMVREINIATGKTVRVIAGPAYRFNWPWALTVAGNDLFVANNGGNSVTEVDASTGALVGVLSGPAYQFVGPKAIVASGNEVFVGSNGPSAISSMGTPGLGHSVTEFPA
ncbi:MAG TPA: hypothetical protein VFN61_00750 [Acidimicrobiales bacterium]|nr:hypothetical protein [Acidimicrobiales bacterium]